MKKGEEPHLLRSDVYTVLAAPSQQVSIFMEHEESTIVEIHGQ